ncbi:MAG: hybrid sensor histidine kinase/response regulator [Thermodesulfovibrionales bacterium]
MNADTDQKPSVPSGLPEKAGIIRIVLFYAAFSALWILFSDRLVGLVFGEPVHITLVNTFKGLAFVAVTSLLLFFLLGRLQRQLLSESLARIKQADSIGTERMLTVEFLRLVNESTDKAGMIRAAVTFFQRQSGCEAVGIRLKEGDDYPYYEARGFPSEFILSENSLCARNAEGKLIRDSLGSPIIECMCGNVICGRFDVSKPFFTPLGSFWTNSTTELLASTSEADRQSRTRNRCHGEGYESVALIGLKAGEGSLGLLQLNDRRKGRFSTDAIAQWERLAGYLGVALAKFQAEDELRASEGLYRSLFSNMLNGFAYCRMIFEDDLPRDFVYLSVNDAFSILTGLTDVVDRKVSEVIPGIRESDPELLEIYGRVSRTGLPERFEMFVGALQKWFWLSVYSPKKDHFVAVFDVITERKLAEAALQESERKYRSLVDHAVVGVYRSNIEGTFLYVNKAMADIMGYNSRDELLAEPVLSRFKRPGDREPFIVNLKEKGMLSGYEVGITTRSGDDKTIVISAVLDDNMISGMVMDITVQKKLEAQLLQAQKMEAIGTLAGGIAHDFNNILSTIVGYGHILQVQTKEDDPRRMNVEEILNAADRATALTHSLLAFSRKQVMHVRPVQLNDLVRRVETLLRRIIGEDISIRTAPGEDRITVMADSGQIEQVLMNLATNARDAMPHGGTFTIRISCVELDESFVARHGYGNPGAYTLLTVADTGEGMDEETRRRIFEPFFTTKEFGKGTGLGLSVVYGIIKQHDGYIEVSSEPGAGTTFKIYLPLSDALSEPAAPAAVAASSPTGGTETILLAEDDASLRKLARIVLEAAGYTVITAEDGKDAVRKFIEHNDEVDLVILDMIMPQMNGREAYEQIRSIRPDVRALFASGYTADKAYREGTPGAKVELLLKPILPNKLLKKVREILERPASGG